LPNLWRAAPTVWYATGTKS